MESFNLLVILGKYYVGDKFILNSIAKKHGMSGSGVYDAKEK